MSFLSSGIQGTLEDIGSIVTPKRRREIDHATAQRHQPMIEPERLPPPPFWRTRYFAFTVMGKADRRWIDPIEIARALAQPIRKERQSDGRLRQWAYIPRLAT
jgi:hypothetical protein